MIPPEKLREISERLSIVDLIGDYVSLKKSGSNYLGLCPFHGEKSPSFNVNPAKEIFHCFGCSSGGDMFSFLMRIEGVSFPEAVSRLAARAGVQVEDRPLTDSEKRAKGEKEENRLIMALAAEHYREVLTRRQEGAAARNYLLQREVDSDTAAAYGLGYAFERRDSLVQAIRSKGLSIELAGQLGVVRNSDRGWYDLFYNRLIFPIRDPQGQVIALAGRVLDNSLPKYINSPESPLYKKSSVLFGTDMALRDVRKSGNVIVVEGYFDHLALFKAGVKNVLATCGTALTDGHIGLLKKHAERVFLLFDSDNAGRKATVRAMEFCLEQKLPVYVITLPQGDDPDSFLQQHGADAFHQMIEGAKPAFEQYLHWLLAKMPPDNVDTRVRLMGEIAPRFRKISDQMERDLYENEICRLLNVERVAFRKSLSAALNTKQLSENPAVSEHNPAFEKKPPRVRDRAQETLLGLLAEYPGARDEVRRIGPEKLFDKEHLSLSELLLQEAEFEDDLLKLWQRVFARIEEPSIKELGTLLMVNESHLSDIDWKVALRQCLERRDRTEMKELQHVARQLATLPPDSDKYKELLRRAEQLRNQKSAIK